MISQRHRDNTTAKTLLVLLLVALTSLAAPAADWFNGFDSSASTNAWNCWWASPAATIGWTGSLDASNNPASGSIRIAAPFKGAAGEQFMVFDTFAGAWSWNPGVVLILDGLNFLAGGVRLASTNCIVQNCNAKYVSHFTVFNWQNWQDGAELGQDGWYLDGDFNTISNCSIDFSAGAGTHHRRRQQPDYPHGDFGYGLLRRLVGCGANPAGRWKPDLV